MDLPATLQVLLDFLRETRDLFNENALFGVGVLLLASFFAGKIAQRVSLPSVSGYIVVGLLLGPHMLKVVGDTADVAIQLGPIPHVALGLIALTIGARFSLSEVKRLGRPVAVVTVSQLITTFGAVSLGLWAFGMPFPVALVLGAIASATAPAATIAVINEYRARGPMTDALVATIALDDFGAVLLFSLAFALCRAMLGGGMAGGPMLLRPLIEIGGSVLVGSAVGTLIHLMVRGRRNNNETIIIVLGWLLFSSALTIEIHLSPLITNMVTGFVLINLSLRHQRVLRLLEPLEAPIFAAFFALAGCELDLRVLPTIGVLGGVYIVARLLGKYAGAWLGAALAGMSSTMRRWLGLCLFPQAGVAIGLVLIAQEMMHSTSLATKAPPEMVVHMETMVSIVIASVLVNELLGPPLVKLAIFRSGEVPAVSKGDEGGKPR